MSGDRGIHHGRTRKKILFIAAWTVVLLLGSAAASHGSIQQVDNELWAAALIAEAMDIPPDTVCACIPSPENNRCGSLPPGCPAFSTTGFSAHHGKGISTSPVGLLFSRAKSGTFGILATGLVESADNSNLSERKTTVLERLNNEEGNDLVELHLTLKPPAGATCLTFDYAFYSEEYPEFDADDGPKQYLPGDGRRAREERAERDPEFEEPEYDDTFTAAIRVGNDREEFASESMSASTFSNGTGTTYDGGTALTTAVASLDPLGGPVNLVLSIEDIGDSQYDSAVFLDNFRWITDPDACEGGVVQPPADTDEDGLLDDWETGGVDIDGDGVIDLDLPALGASPLHKDIFLEIDFMAQPEVCVFNRCRQIGHNHQPEPEALARVIEAFARAPVDNPDGTTGIRLHIDAGPESFFDLASRVKWADRSRSDLLPHDDQLGSFSDGIYDWTEFDQIKETHFSAERRPVFHYAVFAHFLGDSDLSGASRSIPGSDFIVSLGAFAKKVGSVREQAGTLMHELGHNLGLDDGGGDPTPYKPNYLSVMNPFFQMRGLRLRGQNGRLDYSFEELSSLDEADLDESAGLGGSEDLRAYGTRFFCPSGAERVIDHVNEPRPINWNCNGLRREESVAADINRSGGDPEVLDGYNDWENIIFEGGSIGQLGGDDDDDGEGEGEDEEEEGEEGGGIGAQADALIPTDFDVLVTGISKVAQLAGTTQVYDFQVKNIGENADTYALGATSDLGWANVTTVPATVALAPGDVATVSIAVTIPAGTPANTEDEVTLRATSVTNEFLLDAATTSPYVPENPPVAHAGTDQRVECSSHNGTPVMLDGSGSQAPSGGILEYQWTGPFPEGGGKVEGVRPTVTMPLGVSTITLRVNDGIVDSYPDTVVVTVVDTIPPEISASVAPTSLWPPDHTMKEIRATVIATDICTPPTVALTFVTSSEPDDAKGGGDGHTTNDIQGAAIGTPDFLFSVRAERSGSGPGRIYTARYTATDSSGNQAWDEDQVKVPHSQKK
jgi:hypothetical protein